MISLLMVLIFILGYTLIALEFKTKINKTAISLFLGVSLWVLYIFGASEFVPKMLPELFSIYQQQNSELAHLPLAEQIRGFASGFILTEHLGEVASIIFFLMGAMTIVEVIDRHGGFNFVNKRLTTRNSRRLLWMMMLMTFFMSSVLDNLTTAIVMIMVLRKLVTDQQQRWLYAALVVVAANAGGAFSPIGDVTTILLWIGGNVTTTGIIKVSFIPSFISVAVPTLILSMFVKGNIDAPTTAEKPEYKMPISHKERAAIFAIGLGGLIFTPIFKSLTGLPPFMGVMAGLAILWTYTELIYKEKDDVKESLKQRVNDLIKHIDTATVLFLFGILMSVAALQEAGILQIASVWLDENIHNIYGVNVLIGLLSAFVDNGSLVAGVMGMYPIATEQAIAAATDPAYMGYFTVDGEFWNLLAYCAGTGGSLTIIGSAAGVMVMGLEKMTFDWYFKKFSWMVLIGYLSGVVTYYLQSLFGLL